MFRFRKMLYLAIVALVAGIGVLVVQSPAQAVQTCSITVGGYRGAHICAYSPTVITWPDGHRQYFVVGTTWQVYSNHEWPPRSSTWSGWYSLGGIAHSAVWVTNLTSTTISVNVIGTTGKAYVRPWRADGGWSGWSYNGNAPIQRIVVGGREGWHIAAYRETVVHWPNGRVQFFVVGTDFGVWETHELWPGEGHYTGWARVGNGVAHSQVLYIQPGDEWNVTIVVIGTDGREYYCGWNIYVGCGEWYPY